MVAENLSELSACAFKIFRKRGFQDGLMRLIRVCGVEAEPPVRAAVKGDRHPLLAFPLLWRVLILNRRGAAPLADVDQVTQTGCRRKGKNQSPIEPILQYRFATLKTLKARPGPDRCKIAPLCNPSL